MSDLKVTFGALSTASADIHTSANKLQQILDDMDRSLAPLRANWDGEASNAYAGAKAKWTSAITDMKALLADVGAQVDHGNSAFQGVEKDNTRRW